MSHPILASSLRVNEIFHSIQGESVTSGVPTVFIRLSGCPLRCSYCDTEYAFKDSNKLTLASVLDTVKKFNCTYVTVTGGEPLAQQNCLPLLSQLCDRGYRVSLETSGALSVAAVDSRVSKVVDLKTPSSGECAKNLYSNLDYISQSDQIKFVIGDRADYDWSVERVQELGLVEQCSVLFSPVYEELSGKTLAEWILSDRLNVRFQVQLHKILWGEERAR